MPTCIETGVKCIIFAIVYKGCCPYFWLVAISASQHAAALKEVVFDAGASKPTGDRKMKLSARNVFEGIVKEVKKGATTSHVLVDVKGMIFTASITNDAVEDLGLKTGSKVHTIIKSSDIIIGA